jgi:hypothetical protein
VNTTIALSKEVYKIKLDVKHDMEKRVGHPLSFSKAEKHLCDFWNGKIKKSDLNEVENKETI